MPIPCSNCKKECLSELVGTYLLVLIGPASVVITASIPSLSSAESLLLIALTFGGVVGLLILTLGIFSGAVINPALTVAAFASKNLKSGLLLPYMFFQVVGGVGAGFSLKILFSSFDKTSLGSTKLASGVDPLTGILVEALGTFILASSALIAGSKLRKNLHRGILVGVTLFILIIFIGPITGASFNPARSLGPALASGYFANLYVYLIGPTLGALVAGILFRVVNERIARKEDSVCVCS